MSDIQPGPCVACGLRNYGLSFGGPTICPGCDAGDSGPSRMNAQRVRIETLERELALSQLDNEALRQQYNRAERELAEANAVIKHLEGAATAWKDKCEALREALAEDYAIWCELAAPMFSIKIGDLRRIAGERMAATADPLPARGPSEPHSIGVCPMCWNRPDVDCECKREVSSEQKP